MKRNYLFILVAVFSVLIGFYPLTYAFVDRSFGLLSSKDPLLLKDTYWNVAFALHLTFGGLSLLIGWLNFHEGLRRNRLAVHRAIGKVYVISVLLGGISGIYIGIYATGGLIAAAGFVSLGVVWLVTTLLAYSSVRKGEIEQHRKWMTYSYAATMAAVTLRIWLPLLAISFSDFIIAYRITAWVCWVPNIIWVAFRMSSPLTARREASQV